MSFFLTDIINYFYILFLIYFFYVKKIIDLNQLVLLSISSLSPIFMFGFLFQEDSIYFGDASFYAWSLEQAKLFYFDKLYHTKDIIYSSVIFSFVPIPFFNSPNSVGFICKIIFVLLICLLNYFKINKNYSYLFIIMPSSILYSGIGTKDTLVAFFMILGFIAIAKNNYFFLIVSLLILINIKTQNVVFLILFFVFYQLLFYRTPIKLVSSIFIVGALFLGFKSKITHYLSLVNLNNYYRDFQHANNVPIDSIEEIPFLNESILFHLDDFVLGNYRFFLLPNPFEAINSFQFIQSIENYLVIFILIMIIYRCLKSNLYKSLFWIFGLFFMAGLYGLIIDNYGTLVRMKFSIILSFLIILLYESQIDNKKIKNE